MALFPALATEAHADQITGLTASGASADGHGAELAIDGNPSTYWQSPGSSSTQDYRRFLDFDLGGLYSVTGVTVQNVSGSSYRFEVYLSEDGKTYDKVAYKSDDAEATETPESYTFDAHQARYARINVSWNSSSQAVNLAEVSFEGTLVSDEPYEKEPIEITPFAESEWGEEWERFESDADYAAQKTVDEVYNLIGRVLGDEYRDWFDLGLRDAKDGKDVFEIYDGEDGRIAIRGNDGVSLASGLNYYLRYWCKVDYNPIFGSNLDMPDSAPAVGEKVLKYTNYEYRYALNFCTYSYTMSFWSWDEYEPFLDWAAMNGVNLMLDIVGQEEVIRETLTQYGYTDDEVKEYISGPGYFAWFYMQNMYSWGGPLPDSWFEQRVELGRQIHDRMQTFGITPVIQGFGGQVPEDFAEKNPTAVAASSGTWSGFKRPYMIKTYLTDEDRAAGKEDYFDKVGTTFYEAQENVFGDVSSYYAVDPFHEGGTIPEGFDIVDIYRTVQEKMLEHDEDAVWVMQQWQNGINTKKLSGLANKDQALVLDLQSDLRSQASPMEEVGVPWTWDMLHNFGGRMGMDGVPEVIATEVTEAYNNSEYMVGIGITPEAIDNSPIVYELLFDMTWEQDPIDYREWTSNYIERRYGGTDEKIQEAWDILLETAYAHKDGEYYQGASESIINARPSDGPISSASTWGHSDIDYDKERFEEAARLFVECYDTYKDSEAFRYDFVDVMRQVLQNAFQEYQPLAGEAYKANDLELFRTLSSQMLEIVELQDELLSSSDYFLVGTWIENARTMLEDEDDWTQDLFELNARALITTWGLQKNSSLVDYSNRQWAGLTGEYYYERWETYVKNRLGKLEDGTSFSDPNWFMYGWEWANRKSDEGFGFATEASDVDQKALAEKILESYSVSVMDQHTDGGSSAERVNLAAGKDVVDVETSSSVEGLTDGNTGTGWAEPGKQQATLEIDLGGTYSITGAELALQQIAADFPLRYEVQVYNGSEWVSVGSDDSGTLSSKNEVSCDVMGSKVRFVLESSDGANLTGIYELAVYGAAQPEVEYTNLARKATASAKSNQDSKHSPKNAIDGSEQTLWINNGAGESWFKATLKSAQRVDVVRLVFETAGRQFQFRIVVGYEDGTEKTILDKTDNQGELDREYSVGLGEEIMYVKVEFTGAVEGTKPWPAIAELEMLQEQDGVTEDVNIASTASITSSPTKDAPEDTSALVDGTGTAWISRDGQIPAWFQLDLPSARYVSSICLKFEDGVPDRSMQFQLTVTNEAGEKTVVYERTADDLSEEQGLQIDVPVNATITSVHMDIQDARIPSSGRAAWPLVAEIEVYSSLENLASSATLTAGEGSSLDADDLAALADGLTNSTVTLSSSADKSLVMALDEPSDVSGLAIATDGSSLPVRFKAEYRVMDAEGNPTDEFKTLVDYSSSTIMKANVMARLSKSVFTDQVRVTFLNEGELGVSDIMLYKADVTSSLVSQISSVRDYLEGLTYGEFAGNYSESARDALLAVLDEADAAISGGLNSLEVAGWSVKVSDAVSTFYHEGFVSLERNSLYVGIDDAEALVSALEQQGLEKVAATLKEELAAAKQVAESYGNVTQADIDSAAEKLGAACDAALASLDATDRFEVTIAQVEELLDGAEIGDFDGQYPQAAADKLSAAIESARAAYEAAGGDATAIDTATSALAAAKDEFMASVVRIDASALEQELARAEGLDESSYDKDAWAEFVAARDAAKAVDTSKISQADLDALVSALAEKIDALEKARLDRSDLLSLIATAQGKQEGDYTEDSWSAFAEAYERALEVRDAVSTTQAEVDEAAQNLLKAMDSLVGKNHGGTDEPEPEPASEQEMYRLYNRWTGEHFYTASAMERDVLVRVGWAFEGVGWHAPAEGDEVMRLYNPYVDGGDHHYTLDEHEYEALQGLGWRGEGHCWFSADPESDGAVEILRQYNPFAETGTHNYTPDRAENDALVGLGWEAEGVAWYGVAPADK